MNDHKCAALAVFGMCWLLTGRDAVGQPLQPLTLERAVTRAEAHSAELAEAKARYAVAKRQEAQARAPFRPTLIAGSGAGFTYGFPMTVGGAAPSVFNLSYIQTLFNPQLRGHARAARQRVEVERLGLEAARDAVMLRTALVFLDLVRVRHALEVQRGARGAVQRIQELTSSRVAEGRELAIETVRAELSGARAEQRIIELEGREDALATELGDLAGLPGGQPIEIVPETLAPQPDQPIADLIGLALANNSELQQAEYERQAGVDRVKGERGGYWPSVDLVSEYATLSKINHYDEFFRKFQRHNLNAGIQAQWSIFSARTTAAVKLARSELQLAEVELRRKREEVERTVRRESQRARERKAIRDVAWLELRLAQEHLRILQERFQAARANVRDVEGARLEESDKWIAFLQADYEGQQAQLELLKTTGQLRRVFP